MEQSLKALVIDDDDTVRNILTAFMHKYQEDRGLKGEVATFSDPVQGLFELSSNGEQYDVILLDVRMPKLTGDEIYNSLLHVNPELLSRIMFVTAYADDVLKRFADQQPRVLPKPFQFDGFVSMLDEIRAERS